jgi:hypothetical protein
MGGRKGGGSFRPEDYYPLPEREQTPEEMAAILKATFGGTLK